MKKLLLGLTLLASMSSFVFAGNNEIKYFTNHETTTEGRFIQFNGSECLGFVSYSDLMNTSMLIKQDCRMNDEGQIEPYGKPSFTKTCDSRVFQQQQRQEVCIMNCGFSFEGLINDVSTFSSDILDAAKKYEKAKWDKKNYKRSGLLHKKTKFPLTEVTESEMLNANYGNVLSDALNNLNVECTDAFYNVIDTE